MSWLDAIRRWFGAAAPEPDDESEQLAARRSRRSSTRSASRTVRQQLERAASEALAIAERASLTRAATSSLLEASLHLGERLRAAGRRDPAVLHFEQAVRASFRVADPVEASPPRG